MRRLAVSLFIVALALLAGRAAQAGPPTDQLKGGIDRVLAILQDPALKQPGKAEERRQKIRAVANEVFDWTETGKRALGPALAGPVAAGARGVLEALRRSYRALVRGQDRAYSGEKIVYGDETRRGDQATVRTKLLTKNGTPDPDRLSDAQGGRPLARLRREDRERGPGRQLPLPVQPHHPAVELSGSWSSGSRRSRTSSSSTSGARRRKKP